MTDRDLPTLRRAADLAVRYLEGVDERPAGPTGTAADVRAALGGLLPDEGVPAPQVVEELAAAVEPALVASAGPRYFGFVTGGAVPAALAADWLASAWDQNGFSAVSSPPPAPSSRSRRTGSRTCSACRRRPRRGSRRAPRWPT